VKKTFEVLTPKSSIGISIILILLFVSCARKINFATSQIVPAARGFVKIKKDNNENYLIKMEVSNLAEIERLIPANQTYVVWMVSDDMQPKNIGRLSSSSSLMSSKLKASLKTTSTLKPHKIFITTEEIASTQYPGNRIILTTDLF
jgi:hypothetical protein